MDAVEAVPSKVHDVALSPDAAGNGSVVARTVSAWRAVPWRYKRQPVHMESLHSEEFKRGPSSWPNKFLDLLTNIKESAPQKRGTVEYSATLTRSLKGLKEGAQVLVQEIELQGEVHAEQVKRELDITRRLNWKHFVVPLAEAAPDGFVKGALVLILTQRPMGTMQDVGRNLWIGDKFRLLIHMMQEVKILQSRGIVHGDLTLDKCFVFQNCPDRHQCKYHLKIGGFHQAVAREDAVHGCEEDAKAAGIVMVESMFGEIPKNKKAKMESLRDLPKAMGYNEPKKFFIKWFWEVVDGLANPNLRERMGAALALKKMETAARRMGW